MKRLKKNIHDWGATALGLLVAIAQAYMTVDWANFDFRKEWPKLLASAAIAAGGYFSKFKGNEKP